MFKSTLTPACIQAVSIQPKGCRFLLGYCSDERHVSISYQNEQLPLHLPLSEANIIWSCHHANEPIFIIYNVCIISQPDNLREPELTHQKGRYSSANRAIPRAFKEGSRYRLAPLYCFCPTRWLSTLNPRLRLARSQN